MSDFIATMAARTMGEIPTVEPLTGSMYLPLPAMPGDYTEDASWESEPSAPIDDEPDLSFMPLVISEEWSGRMPRGDKNLIQDSETTPRVEFQPDRGKIWEDEGRQESTIITGYEVTLTEGVQPETEAKLDAVTETPRYSVVPQVNPLETVQNSVEVDEKPHLQAEGFGLQLPLDSNQTPNYSDKQLTQTNNPNLQRYGEGEREESNSDVTVTPTEVSEEISSISIAPQYSVSANVELTSPISTSSSEVKFPIPRQFESVDEGEVGISTNMEKGNGETASQSVKANVELTSPEHNSSSEVKFPISRQFGNVDEGEVGISTDMEKGNGETASQSVKANVELTSSISDSQSNVQFPISRQSTNIDEGEVGISTDMEKGNGESVVNSENFTTKTETSSTIAPQINLLDTASQSVKANVELTSPEYNSSSEVQFPIPRQFGNVEEGEVGISTNMEKGNGETASQSVKANVELTSPEYNSSSEVQFPISRQSANIDEGEVGISTNMEKGNGESVVNSENFTTKTETSSTIAPQINLLDAASDSVKANVELTSPEYNSSSEVEFPIPRQFESVDEGEVGISTNMEKGNGESVVNSENFTTKTETSSTIAPQINLLDTASQSVEANVELTSSISTSDSGLTQLSDDTQTTLNRQFTNAENGKTHKYKTPQKRNTLYDVTVPNSSSDVQFSIPKQSTHIDEREVRISTDMEKENGESVVNSDNLTRKTEISANMTPQVKRLETASQSLKPNVELILPENNSESELHQDLNNTHTQFSQQLTNTENLSIHKNIETQRLNSNQQQNTTFVNTGKQEVVNPNVNRLKTQNVKAKVELTLPISTLKSDSHPFVNTQIPEDDNVNTRNNPVKATRKEENLTPQVNQLEIVKPSVNSDINLDSPQLYSQSSLQIEITNRKNIPENSKEQKFQSSVLSNAESSNHSQLSHTEANQNNLKQEKAIPQKIARPITYQSGESSVSQTSQSVQPNLQVHLNLIKGDSNNQSNPHSLFKGESQLANRIASVRPNIQDLANLSPPTVKTSSPVHSKTQPRLHQAEPRLSPTIQVTIGRIEVRGIQPTPSPISKPKQSTKKSPALTLQDYLKQRDGK
ncbi:MAG: hypothetical protein QNJ47_10150 [Nostocaceae cyanobacterium]|nr:hypothetical protein [Nostocaceae cyanobacterium]